jgi:hypothetical protein
MKFVFLLRSSVNEFMNRTGIILSVQENDDESSFQTAYPYNCLRVTVCLEQFSEVYITKQLRNVTNFFDEFPLHIQLHNALSRTIYIFFSI